MIIPSRDSRRLPWTLDDPSLERAIGAPDASKSPVSQQPYHDSATETWHEVSQSSMFEPRCSSITVCVDDLDPWEDNWLEYHRHSEDPDYSMAGARWGTNLDFDPCRGLGRWSASAGML